MLNIQSPAGVKNFDEPENMEIPQDEENRKAIFDVIAMQMKSQINVIAMMYTMSKRKKFPYPLKIYFDKTKKYYMVGAPNNKDFKNQKVEYSEDTRKNFSLFYLLCKLQDENNWCSILLISASKAIFNFSNGKNFKYGS